MYDNIAFDDLLVRMLIERFQTILKITDNKHEFLVVDLYYVLVHMLQTDEFILVLFLELIVNRLELLQVDGLELNQVHFTNVGHFLS